MIIILILIIICYHYLIGYKLFDNYKLKKNIINYCSKLNIMSQGATHSEYSEGNEDPHVLIPLNIFSHWHTLDLPLEMNECVNTIKQLNPEFNYYLYDTKMSRQFIKDNFHIDVLDSYDHLIPEAYKADLWRYCILYVYGGIYLDIKFRPVNGFKLINLIDREYFIIDRPHQYNLKNNWCVSNGFIITKKNNPILLKCIEKIVNNVKNKYYGDNCLHPTGPALLGEIYFNSNSYNNCKIILSSDYCIKFRSYMINADWIHFKIKQHLIYQNNIILEKYDNYRKDQKKYIDSKKTPKYYGILWKEKKIYK
jgi:hypothetical protein